MKLLTFAVVLVVAVNVYSVSLNVPGVSAPIHAQCSVTWKWPEVKCLQVQEAILSQMKKWESDEGCKDGSNEKCLYKILSQDPGLIKGTHETPLKHYIDDISFKFVDTESQCQVEGFSTSETWYAILDYGTNYCNLNNLITGASLDKVPGYVEITSDSICTQYSTANCTRY